MRTPGIALWALACLGLSPALAAPLDDVDRPATVFDPEAPMSDIFAVTATEFDTSVVQSETPVILDFWAAWCGPCKTLSPILDELATEYDGRVRVGKVNVDEEQALAMAFGVRSIPMLAVVKEGEIVHLEAGFRSREAVEQLFRQAAG